MASPELLGGAARGANAAYIEEQRRVLAQFRADATAGTARPQVVARVPPAGDGAGPAEAAAGAFTTLEPLTSELTLRSSVEAGGGAVPGDAGSSPSATSSDGH